MKSRMRFFGLAIAVLILECPTCAQDAQTPRLVLSQESWDFGKVWYPEQPKLTLTVRNEGSADLKIADVRSTCTCTVAQPGRKLIPPGQSTDIEITFITKGKQGDTGSTVIIHSNDPARPKAEFKIKGYVKRAIHKTPDELVIRSKETQPGQTSTIRLESQMSEPMKLEVRSNSIAAMDLEIKEITPGQTYELIGRTNRELEPGKIRGQLVLSTGLTREPMYSILTGIWILSTVEPHPPAIWVPKDSSTPCERRIVLSYYGSDPGFRVTGASCEGADVRVKLQRPVPPSGGLAKRPPPPTLVVHATIALPPGRELPEKGLAIEFATNDPQVPIVKVPVTTDQREYRRLYAR